jgi:MinD-like ATPase involved in chromosome partitioning or flagellar assembly
MSVIALASAKSSPGVSTIAEVLALCRRLTMPCALLDCDPAGGDWLVRPGVVPEPGLVSLAMAGRRELAAGELGAHLQVVGDGLQLMVAPAAARQATSALEVVGERLADYLRGEDKGDVVVDCGRLGRGSPAWPLAASADLLVLVSNPTAAAVVHLAPLVDQARSEGASIAVALVQADPHHDRASYPATEVGEALGVEVVGVVAHDPAAAARLHDRPGSLRGLERTRLVRSTSAVTARMTARFSVGRLPGGGTELMAKAGTEER